MQYFGMHATVATLERRPTSLGAGATECSNGAHEDNEGHESSHSNADDHRHWERFCIQQNVLLQWHSTSTLYVSWFQFTTCSRWVHESTRSQGKIHHSISNAHIHALFSWHPLLSLRSNQKLIGKFFYLLVQNCSVGIRAENTNKYNGIAK